VLKEKRKKKLLENQDQEHMKDYAQAKREKDLH
jgi:hypothetical protein